jgi:hypothetical protein
MTDTVNACRKRGGRVRPAFGWLKLLLLCGALILTAGCGRQAVDTPSSDAGMETAEVPLPEWAPENPSPEFLRAARVLKPLPEDVRPYSPLVLASYELFGTLTDEQIAAFQERRQSRLPLNQTSEEVRDLFKKKYGAEEVGRVLVYDSHEVAIPVPSLTPAQRKAFDRVAEAWRETFAGRPDRADLVVQLYEIGARKDLSNVHVTFDARGHAVGLSFQVRSSKGVNSLAASDFAQL